MATIKIRRGSGQPSITGTGLTAYEPAWDTTNNRFFINTGSTAMWIGAAVIQDTTLSGNCAWTIPTQNSVKTYVDNSVSAGAVSSVNGVTGAITIGAGTGISISTSTAARGITVTNVGVTGLTGTVNQITVSGTTGSITLSLPSTIVAPGSLSVTGLLNPLAGISANGGMTLAGTSVINGLLTVTENASFLKGINVTQLFSAAGGISAAGGLTIDSVYTRGNLAVDGSATLLGGFDAKGATFGNLVRFLSGISANGGMTLGGSLQAAAATFSGLVTANSGLVVNGGATFNGNIYASNLVTSVNGLTGAVTDVASLNGATGAVTVGAGTGISIATSTAARGITVTNVGVTGLTGTANQITVSGTTGSITLSLPSAITVPGSLATTTTLSVGTDLTVSGNLTVNGTTTTVNSTTVTVQDPLIAIGGITGNVPPPVGDTKDRGILFQWNNGSTGQTGFFGFDRAAQRFSFIPTGAAVSGELVTGIVGNAEFTGVYAPHGTLTLEGTCASSAQVTIVGGTGINSTAITKVAKRHVFRNGTLSGEECQLEIGSGVNQTPEVYTILKSNAGSLTNSNKTLTFPDFSGSLIAAATSGATSGFILRAAGASSIPTWFDPNTAGFTAFTSTNTVLSAIKDSSSYNVIFATGTAGNQIFYADSQAGIKWQPSTDTLTVGSGLGKFEGVIEGGTF